MKALMSTGMEGSLYPVLAATCALPQGDKSVFHGKALAGIDHPLGYFLLYTARRG